MRLIIICLVITFILQGCSTEVNPTAPVEQTAGLAISPSPQETRWAWNTGIYQVSANHLSIERLPQRAADWHLNVNMFVEPPFCDSCLMIGKPAIQPDGTMKVNVILSHPFPNQPKYTGFDVRGTIMFPATRYWEMRPMKISEKDKTPVFDPYGPVPLYFSRGEDGGGQLLNADGFTLFFFPGLDIGPDKPIFKYSKGQYANGPDPDSTVNGYKLFTNDPDRRMFLVTDTISRTYHISPPEGEFVFGYVIDASWAPPINIPVTDPANDFPIYANCEDGYIIETEQVNPFILDTYIVGSTSWPREVTKATIIKQDIEFDTMESWLVCPDIIPDPELKDEPIAYTHITEYGDIPGSFAQVQKIRDGIYNAVPGEYLALVFVQYYYVPIENYADWPILLYSQAFFDFMTIEVVNPE